VLHAGQRASWANPVKAQFGPVRAFVMVWHGSPSHTVLVRKLQGYLHWRDAHARHPGVLAAQRCGRARIRRGDSDAGPLPAESRVIRPVNVLGHRTSARKAAETAPEPVFARCRHRPVLIAL
jgi:hypothetical protein